MRIHTLLAVSSMATLTLLTACILEEEPVDSGPTVTECEVIPGEGCYWMENYDDLSCWVQAPQGADTDYNTCREQDSCTEGGGAASGGGCYKWSDGNQGAAANWACEHYDSPEGACYWMENQDNQWCWVPAPEGEVALGECQELDSCSENGGGTSGGGCYKWSESSSLNGDPWASSLPDADGDGAHEGEDCDDNDASRYPGNTEICDGVDNDCDGILPYEEADADADGVMICEADCDDNAAYNFPGNPEICDGLDNDCDGELGTDAGYETALTDVTTASFDSGTGVTFGPMVTPEHDITVDTFEIKVGDPSGSVQAYVVLYSRSSDTEAFTLEESEAITLGSVLEFNGKDNLGWDLDAGTQYMIGMSVAGNFDYDFGTTSTNPPWGSFDDFQGGYGNEGLNPETLAAIKSGKISLTFRIVGEC